MAAVRNEKGQFVKGHPDIGAGRKPRETEQYFTDLFRDCVSDADFRGAVGAMVKAANRGNVTAAKLLFDYLMGPPVQKNVNDNKNSGEYIFRIVNDTKRNPDSSAGGA